jgi:hypothetical protein
MPIASYRLSISKLRGLTDALERSLPLGQAQDQSKTA